MARRFGGRYSPGAGPSEDAPARAAEEALRERRRVDAAGAKANLLFVPPSSPPSPASSVVPRRWC